MKVLNKRYRLDTEIGRGGFGSVFRAFDTTLNRPVAIKILNHKIDRKTGKLFWQEAQITASMNHHHIVTVLDFSYEEETGQPFIVMELLQGISLSNLLREVGRLPQGRAIHIGLQICSALQAVHSKGILHRDLKPANIIIQQFPDFPDYTKVVDFGISILLSDAEVSIAGTPAYMAPELFRGESPSRLSDIYALGVVIYEMLAGHPLFIARSVTEIAEKHISEPPPSLKNVGVSVAPSLEELIMACLQKQTEKRPQSVTDIYSVLTGVKSETEKVYDSALVDSVGYPLYGIAFEKVAGAISCLFVCGQQGTTAYTLKSRKRFLHIKSKETVGAIAVYNDSLAIGTASGEVIIYNLRTCVKDFSFKAYREKPGNVTALAFRPKPNNRCIELACGVASGMFSGHLMTYDLLSRKRLTSFPNPGRVLSIAFDPTGQYLAYTCFDEPIIVYDLAQNKVAHKFYTPDEKKWDISFSPDSSLLASAGGQDESVYLWDLSSGSSRSILKGHKGEVTSVAFHPKGLLLASGGQDCIRIWGLFGQYPPPNMQVLARHQGVIQKLSFSPDGYWLASVCSGGEVRLWHQELGGLIDTPEEFANKLTRGGHD